MRINQPVSDRAQKNQNISINNDVLAIALVGVGALLIAAGPYLSGTSQTLGSWCHHAAGFSAQSWFQDLIWLAGQHCGYCYLGAAMIGIGIATALRRAG